MDNRICYMSIQMTTLHMLIQYLQNKLFISIKTNNHIELRYDNLHLQNV